MSISIPDFWRLAIEGGLLSMDDCQRLAAQYGTVPGAIAQTSTQPLAEWLVSVNALSPYQAAILQAGRSGPFFYGEYKVIERIESGRMAGAFRAQHAPTNHPVLLHFATGALLQQPHFWQAAVGQLQARAGISSPHLWRFFEAVDLGSFKFVVSEDGRGATLDELLAKKGRVKPLDACRLLRQGALGLSSLHQIGQVHGNVQPKNLWIEPNGNVKLLHDPLTFAGPIDWSQPDVTGQLLQQADYWAPEFMNAGHAPNGLTDIYALGCTLFQLLAGQPPFAGGDVSQKLQRHAAEAIQPLEPLGVPAGLIQVVMYMMAKNSTVRFQNVAIVLDQLGTLLDPAKLTAAVPNVLPTLPLYEHYLHNRSHAGTQTFAPQGFAQPSFTPPLSMPTSIPVAPAPTAPVTSIPMGVAIAPAAAPSPPSPSFPNVAKTSPSSSIPSAPTTTVNPARSAGTDRLRQVRKTNKNTPLLVGGSMAGAAVAMLLLFLVLGNMNRKPPELPDDQNNGDSATNVSNNNNTGVVIATNEKKGPTTTPEKDKPATVANVGTPKNNNVVAPADPPRVSLQPDDGKTLWASPTQGNPIAFQYVPPDAQAWLVIRPAAMLATSDGPRVLDALGPAFKTTREAWERSAGTKLEAIDQLILSFHPNSTEFPRTACVVKLKEEVAEEDLLQGWGNPEPTTIEDAKFFTGQGWAFFIPPAGNGRLFVMGPPKDIQEVAKSGAAGALLSRDLERLRQSSDADRHVTFLGVPNFLTTAMFPAEGGKLYLGDANRVRRPLDWFLQDNLQAVLLSQHFSDNYYVELRMIADLSKEKYKLAEEFRNRLAEVPDNLFEYITTLGSNPYWEKVRFQFPNMIRFLHKQSRVGVDDDTAVINAVLPIQAAHNLVFASEMTLASTPGASVGVGPTKKPDSPFKTVDDILTKYKTKLTFEAQSLEFAIQDLAKDVKDSNPNLPFEFKIKILGDDLMRDGITRNQTVRDFKQEDKTVSEILTAMVRKANPVTTVKDPSETDQKLLWVVDKDPDDPSKQIVLVTTRTAANQRKWKLPPEFQPK